MVFAISALTVRDYAKWKEAFDSEPELRRNAGMRSYRIFQVVGSPNELVLVTEYESAEAAEAFLTSDDLRRASERSGVLEMHPTLDTSKLLAVVDRAQA